MAPKKKAQKISLNEFLGDTALGSWADEMESLPNAPAHRIDEDGPHDRFGRKDDFASSRPERGPVQPRDDLPLPTHPPYTAFVGNLAFDLDEMELAQFFGPNKSVKIIKDREEKPKGFGYIEFAQLEDLKEALSKSGTTLCGRTIRVSVAEPPKDRLNPHDGDTKFEAPWRREGSVSDSRDVRESRRRYEGLPHADRPSIPSDEVDDWRSTRPPRFSEAEMPHTRKKGSGFFAPENLGHPDKEDAWIIGSKFRPSSDDVPPGPKFGSSKGRDLGDSTPDDGDWRNSTRVKPSSRGSASPTSSTPPTPQMGRRRLELLPRSTSVSASTSPLSSPKLSNVTGSRSTVNPFGSARPVDVSSREKDIADRLERERELGKDRSSHPMSRTNSRTASERNPVGTPRTPPTHLTNDSSSPPPPSPKSISTTSTVRPSLSFANVARSSKETTLERDVA